MRDSLLHAHVRVHTQVLMDSSKSPRQQPQSSFKNLGSFAAKPLKGGALPAGSRQQGMAALQQYDALRMSKSSHGRLKPELSSSSSTYKSVAGYNSLQIADDDAMLLNNMNLQVCFCVLAP